MQVTETTNEGLKRAFKVVISHTDIADKLDHRLEEVGRDVNLPGFRPGRAPLTLLRKRFGKSLMGEIIEHAINDGSTQALSERGLRPALQPKIEITAFDEGKDLEFVMEMEILPEIEPMDFSKIALERLVVEVDDKQVEDALQRIAEQYKESKPVDEPRPAERGDVVVIDFVGRIDGEAFPGGTAENYYLELGSGSFIPGFEEQLTGVSPGDKVTVKVTFPEDYGRAEMAGKDAVFDVEIKALRAPAPAEVNDDLARRAGTENLEDLRAQMRERLAAEYADVARARLKRSLLDVLAAEHDFPVPDGMVDAEFDVIWPQVQEDIENKRLSEEDAGKSEDELKREYRDIAARRVRLGLLLSTVGERNNIQLSQEEVTHAILEEARRHPGEERQVLEYFQSNPEATANLRAPIFENKVVDFMLEMAEVSERKATPEELFSMPEPLADGKVKGKAKGKAKAKGETKSKAKAQSKSKTKAPAKGDKTATAKE